MFRLKIFINGALVIGHWLFIEVSFVLSPIFEVFCILICSLSHMNLEDKYIFFIKYSRFHLS